MPIKFTQTESYQTYFCTFTCLHCIHLFDITCLYDQIYNWFNIFLNNNHKLIGFVIMPNHVHVLIHICNDSQTINQIISNGKRFFAYEIIKRLECLKRNDILTILANNVTTEERKRKKKHRVFERSSDIKPCYTEKFLLQKLDYIHNNPITGKWHLATIPEQYLHSSAAFYKLNIPHPHVTITHYMDGC